MSNVIQEIANWVLGSYKVRAKEVGGGLIQEVAIVDASGNQVTSFGGEASVYKQRVDEGATNTYVGEAAIGTATSAASWRIKRVSTSGSVTSIDYAGTGAFDQVWDNRASLSYS